MYSTKCRYKNMYVQKQNDKNQTQNKNVFTPFHITKNKL